MFKYTAVIVEPRRHLALSFVLHNFCENLSDEWGIMIWHGTDNIDFVENIINEDLVNYKHRFISLNNLGVHNLTFYQYNDLCFQISFYDSIPTETFLTFQTDALINPIYKDLINKFIDYDYVGAPWSNRMVGNGGLSLRRKSKIIHILKTVPNHGDHEDTYFSKAFKMLNYKVPSYEDALEFSIETIYNPVFFGIHAPWKYLSAENLKSMINICPDIEKLIDLNNLKG